VSLPRTKRFDIAAIFLLALALRVIHVWQLRSSPFFDVLLGDAHAYDEWALRIAGGDWIGHDVFYQAPLYPYFLGLIYSLLGHDLLAVRLIQAAIGAGSCALLALAGWRFFSEEPRRPQSSPVTSSAVASVNAVVSRVGFIAGIGLAIYAPAIFFDSLLQKAVLDLFFLSLSLWLMARLLDDRGHGRLWLALGLAMGALSLTRENALVFVGVILVWCLASTPADTGASAVSSKPSKPRKHVAVVSGVSRTRNAAIFVLGLAIVLLPVAVRNYAVGGGFYLTTSQFGPNFFIGNNPNADGTYMSLRFGRGAPEYERQDATELAEHAAGRTLTPSEVSSYWTERALGFIAAHPGQWLALVGRKFVLLVNGTEMLDTESQESYAEWSWPLKLLGWFGHFGVLVPLAAIGMLLSWADRKRIGILYVLTGIYAASVLMFYVFARYRLPLVALFMLFAAAALARIPAFLRTARPAFASSSRRDRPLTVSTLFASSAAVLVVSAAVVANWPLLSKPLMMAITETNLAVALQTAGRPRDAVEHYHRAIALQPDYAPAYNNLGVAERASGEVDQAIASYRTAVAMKPEYPDAHYNLANALLDKNKPQEAAEHFRIALRSIPDSAGVSNNLGIALAAEGKAGDAVAAFRAAVAADPGSAKAHRNLADALAGVGQNAEAFTEFQRAIQLDPGDAGTHYNFASTLLDAGRLDEAIAEFRATLGITPESPEAHNNLGIALGSKGDLDAAISEFQRALALQPGFEDAERNLATARAQRKR
jgi:tetratricopeptide (TPR) repeat protein